jgi:hypothetical protein
MIFEHQTVGVANSLFNITARARGQIWIKSDAVAPLVVDELATGHSSNWRANNGNANDTFVEE